MLGDRRPIPFDPTPQPVPDLSNSLPLVLRLRDGREMDIHEAAKLVALQRETSPPAPPPPEDNGVFETSGSDYGFGGDCRAGVSADGDDSGPGVGAYCLNSSLNIFVHVF